MPTLKLGDITISQRDLDRLWVGIERHLAAAAPTTARRGGITLPPVDQLIAQAGIELGPAPRSKRKLFGRRKATPVADHLEAAADLIEQRGWTQGALCRGDARCILGAQLLLVQLGHSTAETARAAARRLAEALGGRPQDFNDARARTKEQVVGVLRRAAADARKAGH